MIEDNLRACVRFRLPGGAMHELEPGDIIGRLWSAALYVDNPRVSEAHAMVSLRDQTLKLLALRGRFAVDNTIVAEATLIPGLRIGIARDFELIVESVQLPTEVLAIEGDGLCQHVLSGVSSLHVLPRPRIVPGDVKDADACIWSSGIGWSLRIARSPAPVPLMAGDAFTLHGRTFEAIAVDLDKAGEKVTMVKGGLQSPLNIIARYNAVHIQSENIETVVLKGISARLISELVIFKGPVFWEVLAGEIWPNSGDRSKLRRNFDVSLSRLRKRLREARVRPDLVRTDGTGHLELFLHPRDQVADQT